LSWAREVDEADVWLAILETFQKSFFVLGEEVGSVLEVIWSVEVDVFKASN
jgi:hypothetical protein